MTTPAMRELFMDPTVKLGIQESVISVLAGDVFRRTPWRSRLLLFQAIYYFKSLAFLRQSVSAWLRRRRAVQSA
jgi:hypothetical protein